MSFEGRPWAARKYVARTEKQTEQAAPPSEAEAKLLESKLLARLTEEPWEAEGTFEITLPGNSEHPSRLVIEYESADEDWTQHVESGNNPDNWDDYPQSRSFRRIKNLRIERSNATFDLSEAVGNDWGIYSITDTGMVPPAFYVRGGQVNPERKAVMSFRDVTSLAGLAVLLHEIGHIKKAETYSEDETERPNIARKKKRAGKLIWKTEKADLIDDERSASAFALNALLHHLGSQELEQVRQHLHSGLEQYHRNYKADYL